MPNIRAEDLSLEFISPFKFLFLGPTSQTKIQDRVLGGRNKNR